MPTRVLAPYLGAAADVRFAPPGSATAPGQIPARDLADVYGVGRERRASRLAALFGSRVSHSLSPALHNARFEALGDETLYVPSPSLAVRGASALLAASPVWPPLAARPSRFPSRRRPAPLPGGRAGQHAPLRRGERASRVQHGPDRPRRVDPAGRGDGRRAADGARPWCRRNCPDRCRGPSKEGLRGRGQCSRRGEGRVASGNRGSVGSLLEARGFGFPLHTRERHAARAGRGRPAPCDASLLRPGLLVVDAPYRAGGTALAREARAAGATVFDGFALLSRRRRTGGALHGPGTAPSDLSPRCRSASGRSSVRIPRGRPMTNAPDPNLPRGVSAFLFEAAPAAVAPRRESSRDSPPPD